MKIILDTHIFLWALAEPDKLDKKQRAALESLSNLLYISSISIAEIMIKASIGKFNIDFDPELEEKLEDYIKPQFEAY